MLLKGRHAVKRGTVAKRKVRGCDLATAAQRMEGPDFVDAEQGKAVSVSGRTKALPDSHRRPARLAQQYQSVAPYQVGPWRPIQ